jgi:hypothetical protein
MLYEPVMPSPPELPEGVIVTFTHAPDTAFGDLRTRSSAFTATSS